MAAVPKSPTLRALAGLVLVAAVWFARQMGWINPSDEGSGQASDPGQGTPPRAASTTQNPAGSGTEAAAIARDSAEEIARLFGAQRSDVQVEGSGIVRALLPDDNDAPRHQKFILELANGMTVLVAHNIDLAPRVPLAKGDTLGFNAEYEFTEKGGVLHWTHRDPGGRHEHGWLELDGKRYE